MSFVRNYGAYRACHVANVIMNFVGNHGVNRPCHLANYMQCGNVLAVSRDKLRSSLIKF